MKTEADVSNALVPLEFQPLQALLQGFKFRWSIPVTEIQIIRFSLMTSSFFAGRLSIENSDTKICPDLRTKLSCRALQ